MTVALLLDEMYPHTLAVTLRDKGHDVTAVPTSPELVGKPDSALLDAATAAGQCLVSENVRDFAELAKFTRHGGILLVTGRRWPRSPAGLARLANALHDALSEGRVPGPGEVLWLA